MEYKRTEFLGVFFGGDDAIAKNWTFVEEKVNSVIKSWTFLSKGLSFIGLVLAVNSLCASQLWCCSLHKSIYRPFKRHSLILYGKCIFITLDILNSYSFLCLGNNNNNCLKSNIQCIEIRVQWTVHLGSSHMHVHAVTPKLVICVMYLTSI